MRFVLLILVAIHLTACAPDAPESAAPSRDTLSATAPADTLRPEQYVGTTYPPVPDGFTKRGGTLIVPPGTPADEAAFAFIDVRRGEGRMLWLGRLQRRTPEGEAIFRIVDAVAVPDVADGERFLIEGCTADGAVGYAAVVQDEEAETLTQVRHAWHADRETGRLVRADAAPVTCPNVGFGL